MTTISNDVLTDDIGLSLEHDPELLYWTWKVHVENAASNMATLVQPTGLLSQVLNDPEWDAYAANRSLSPGGTLAIVPRPLAPLHEPIVGGMTNAAISVAKYTNDKHSLIRSLGPTLSGTITPPPRRLQDEVSPGHRHSCPDKIWCRGPSCIKQNGRNPDQPSGPGGQLGQALVQVASAHPHAGSSRIRH